MLSNFPFDTKKTSIQEHLHLPQPFEMAIPGRVPGSDLTGMKSIFGHSQVAFHPFDGAMKFFLWKQ